MTFMDIFKTVLIGIPIGVTVVDLFGYVARVDGVSMQPVLNPEKNCDYVFLNRLALKLQEVSRGDVVSLYSPKNPEQKLIKRVIGM
jgi:inner membrane protease subunit 2